MSDARYCVEYARTGRSGCKKCKQTIEKGVGRIGKIMSNPFSDDGGEMKVWYHTRCMFETLKVRGITAIVEYLQTLVPVLPKYGHVLVHEVIPNLFYVSQIDLPQILIKKKLLAT